MSFSDCKEAMCRFITEKYDPLTVIGLKVVYDGLGSCCDLCEHAADATEGAVMNDPKIGEYVSMG